MRAEERRAAIIAATLPLLLERGTNISTRQIAETAGIAEGTIFSVFPDKDAVVQAVVDAALDPEPTERELAAIDPALPYEERLIEAVTIMQRRAHRIWPLMASVGKSHAHGTAPADFAALRQIVAAGQARLRTDPATAARQLRAVTLAVSNPVLFSGDPMTAREIVTVFLHGILADRRPDGGDGR
jgi:AcrR family transcriptional regulator